MRNQRIRLIGLLLILINLSAVAAFSQSAPQAPGSSPRAVVPITAFNFGNVYRGEIISQVFVIKNVGSADLTMELIPLCGCEVAEVDKVVAPGKEGKAIIEVNTATQFGEITKMATLRTNDPSLASVSLSLKAKVLTGPGGGPVENVVLRPGKHVGPLFVAPDTRAGLVSRRGEAGKVEFQITADQGAVNISRVETKSPRIKCRLEVVEPARSYKVIVESEPTDEQGQFDNQILVHTDSPQLPLFQLVVLSRVRTAR
jgi:hypothetical protein